MILTNYSVPITQRQQAVIPCANNGTANQVARDMWLILAITNTTTNKGVASLFDASGAFELKGGVQNQDGILIEGKNCNYDTFLRDLISTEQYCVDVTKVEITKGNPLQLDNPWSIYRDLPLSKGLQFVQQIDLSIAKNENQFQDNRLTVAAPFSITRKMNMRFDMEAETTMVMRMHISKAVTNG